MIGWLPCLRWGGDRWWLPLSATSAHVLGNCLIASGQSRSVDLSLRRSLVAALKQDPPLLIYTALHQSDEDTSPEQLATWLLTRATQHFASGDASLGCPPFDLPTIARWRELSSFYKTLPWTRWLDEAALFLEVCGTAVPEAWQLQWPKLVYEIDEEAEPTSDQPPLMPCTTLQQLARLALKHQSLESTFAAQLQRTKLGSLKQLAYGLSHEINNPLANISTRAQQLGRGEPDPSRQAILQRIVDQTYRAHEMIADLMFYANPPQAQPKATDLRSTIERVVDSFAEQAQRHSVRLKLELPSEATQAYVDDTMIGEAIRALVRNAIEAIGCEGTIVTSIVDSDTSWQIHVADSGPGISEEARRHAFDPYYSGREAGRGLGLGLCRAYRIARLHHGDISLTSGPAGCVVTLSLPKN